MIRQVRWLQSTSRASAFKSLSFRTDRILLKAHQDSIVRGQRQDMLTPKSVQEGYMDIRDHKIRYIRSRYTPKVGLAHGRAESASCASECPLSMCGRDGNLNGSRSREWM
nr:hypothetical protein CFP56_11132 [Quercus suber]